MLREELNEKDTWDLTTIFANNEEFEKQILKLKI